ncbi:MAG: hydroxymethylglutaryl-CoA reductase, degradative [Deltaproteobacteria bacterium]|nr:hydroxymethylglutaryl-CoA reductase, degradative [Deltaproteobacteria bacterium]
MEHGHERSSRLPGFYTLPISERAKLAARFSGLSEEEALSLSGLGSLTGELVDIFIENAVGSFSLPLGIATNFCVNGKDVLVPMAVEETSVVAAASHGAKLARFGGGFRTRSSEPIMTGQIQLYLKHEVDFDRILTEEKESLLEYANRGQDRLLKRGGGAKDLTWYFIPEIQSLVVLLHINTVDAMGANIVNTMVEKLSAFMPGLITGCEVGLRILTNLTERRLAYAECTIPAEAFRHTTFEGHHVVDKIVGAWAFAWHDTHRATTHNKGVMNGIDPVLIATGNDWRAIEAGAHAFCCREGKYRPMTTWKKTKEGHLHGSIEVPMAVGTVGGVTKLHPTAQAALKLLGHPGAQELAEIICAVGLAQNLSALRALATEGIQHGHMGLHQKNIDLLQKQMRAIQ